MDQRELEEKVRFLEWEFRQLLTRIRALEKITELNKTRIDDIVIADQIAEAVQKRLKGKLLFGASFWQKIIGGAVASVILAESIKNLFF